MFTTPPAQIPELSIVIPLLNERRSLPSLFATLEKQEGIAFEVILCDGGSHDGSCQVFNDLSSTVSFPCQFLTTGTGRGMQLNVGAAHSRTGMLLFLHADSTFNHPHAIARGVASLKSAYRKFGHQRIAGHFPLHFIQRSMHCSWPYYHYAWKTRIHRSYCTHGDQGFLLSRDFFHLIGPFDESLPFLEDVRLAKIIQNCGKWLLLSDVIGSSARRFEQEGFYRRQVLNALVLACEDAGYGDWLTSMPGLYRQQFACKRLQLGPFFNEVSCNIGVMQCKQRLRFWRKIGSFVCDNVWQVGFMADTWYHYRKGSSVGHGRLVVTQWFDKFIAPVVRQSIFIWVAATLAWIWYRWRLFSKNWS